ncbi:beta strand repeat-containing protein [Rubinisphaera margarita]|uniref:beta strand repeat-containing protein n=1 Tax=Rubinisphaera margarita TaxID=2909586 RepID=UPI001EE8BB79|nr:cadherin domain-containing protein [Rubinisphaera margarita]MCG6158220.1 cadherin domain-containing protein [Rubinisphaera margarita]
MRAMLQGSRRRRKGAAFDVANHLRSESLEPRTLLTAVDVFGDATNENFNVFVDGSDLVVERNSVEIDRVALATVTSLNMTGDAGNDSFTIDLTGGVANFTLNVDGEGDTDAISVTGDPGNGADLTAETLTLNSDLTGTVTGSSDTVQVNASASIQDGIEAAIAGGAVNIAAGNFVENVTLNKQVTLSGAGSGDTASDTVITAANGNQAVLELTAGGASAMDRLVVENLRVTGSLQQGLHFGTTTSFTTVQNVVADATTRGIEFQGSGTTTDLILDNVTLSNNTTGLRVSTASAVVGLTIQNSLITNNEFGANVYASSSYTDNENRFDDILITDTVISDNLKKGLYFEKLNNAVLSGLTVTNSGTDAGYAFNAGIDINVKYGNHQNIQILDSTFDNSGVFTTSAGGLDSSSSLAIKARNDSPSYSANPGAVNNILVSGNVFTNATTAIRVGEPGKTSTGADGLVITNNSLTDGSFVGVDNGTSTGVEARGNWWGTTNTTLINNLLTRGIVDFSTYLLSGTDTDPGTVGFQGDFSVVNVTKLGEQVGDGRIQGAVDLVDVGGQINVGDGTYVENVLIDKDLTLLSVNGRASTTIEGIPGVGRLGTVQITNNTTGVTIGDTGKGFTIIGIDNGTPGLENAAVYFQGPHSGATIRDNEIRANGEAGLLTEYGVLISNFVIDNNEFSGKTFEGAQPGGIGFGTQFSTPNVPRQLVTIGNGGGDAMSASATNITFTNNLISGTAGGISSVDGTSEQGNTLVTIDAANSTIDSNTFSGTTTRFGTSLRVRRPGTPITNNTFDSTGLGEFAGHIFVQNNDDTLDQIARESGNTFDRAAYVDGANGTIGHEVGTVTSNVIVFSSTAQFQGNVDIADASTIEGTPDINGTLSTSAAGAVVSPGTDEPGVMNADGLDLIAGSSLLVNIDGTAGPGVVGGHSQLEIAGPVDLGGATLDLDVEISAVTTGDSFIIINNTGMAAVTGTFAGLNEGDSFLHDGQTYIISYTGGDGNDVVVTVGNAAPVVNDQSFGIDEHAMVGTSVGTVVASDDDNADSLTYAITGGNTGGAFAINAMTGEITVATPGAVDFETNPVFNLTVEVTDDSGAMETDSATITITLNDVNEAPQVELTNTTTLISESANTSTRTHVADIVINDDGLGTNDLSLSGSDASLFEIDGNQLYLIAGASLDFETNPVLDVVVEVDDSSVGSTPDDTALLSVNIGDANEAASLSVTNVTSTIPKNVNNSTRLFVEDFTVTDVDAGPHMNNVTVSGPDAGLFEVIGNQVFLKANAGLNSRTNPILNVSLVLDDPGVGSGPESVIDISMIITDPTAAQLPELPTSFVGFVNENLWLAQRDEFGNYDTDLAAATAFPDDRILQSLQGDFNGDGREDIAFHLTNGEVYVGTSTPDGQFNFSLWGDIRTTGVKALQVGDFNADGLADISAVLQNGTRSRLWVYESTGSQFLPDEYGNYGGYSDIVTTLVGNFDGVNGDDLAIFNDSGIWWVAKSDAAGSNFRFGAAFEKWNPSRTITDIQVGNFNGDDKDDIFGVFNIPSQPNNRSFVVGVSEGNRFRSRVWRKATLSGSLNAVVVGDFNADNNDDFAMLTGQQQWTVGLSSPGSSQFALSSWGTTSYAGSIEDIGIGDSNGDGRADILFRDSLSRWQSAESTGSTFVTREIEQWGSSANWQHVKIGSFGAAPAATPPASQLASDFDTFGDSSVLDLLHNVN